jgi:hypothetical protein
MSASKATQLPRVVTENNRDFDFFLQLLQNGTKGLTTLPPCPIRRADYGPLLTTHPRHTSLLKLVAEKQTQFVANNTELDLASHKSYGPENGKNIHELCININVSSLSLVVLHS